jgi:hypothetical protein
MLPWVIYGVIAVVAATGAMVARTREFDWKFYLHLWFWVGLLVDLGYGIPAWWQVRHRFGLLALRRFIPTR